MLEQVEGDAVEYGEVLRGMACAFAIVVFAEADVERPVQCSLFSMPQCWRMDAFSRLASGFRLVM